MHTEHILDLEIAHGTVRTWGMNPELIPFTIEGRPRAEMVKDGIVEISQNRGLRGLVHGQIVVGAFPAVVLGFVAQRTFPAAAERCRGMVLGHLCRGLSLRNPPKVERYGTYDTKGGDNADYFPTECGVHQLFG
jgi:hypothetical protein